MLDERVDPAHQPAVALILLMAVVGALFMTGVNLRNSRLWWLQLFGRRADAVVTLIEFAGGSTGAAPRRPVVSFTTEEGEQVVTKPSLYRTSVAFTKGSLVKVSYAARNPSRIVVHGFDFRASEPVYAVVGLVIAAFIAKQYFKV